MQPAAVRAPLPLVFDRVLAPVPQPPPPHGAFVPKSLRGVLRGGAQLLVVRPAQRGVDALPDALLLLLAAKGRRRAGVGFLHDPAQPHGPMATLCARGLRLPATGRCPLPFEGRPLHPAVVGLGALPPDTEASRGVFRLQKGPRVAVLVDKRDPAFGGWPLPALDKDPERPLLAQLA